MTSVLSPEANAGRVALITGGGTGIGRATAVAFAESGAAVAICGRRVELLEATAAAIESKGGRCLVTPADVREPDEVSDVVERVMSELGAVDVLVNNAGGQFQAAAEDITLKGWRAVHRLNVDAAWELTRQVASATMIPRRSGLIVFIGFSPRRGIPGMVHASAARAAVENLAGGLAAEWGPYGIRAVCVAPGNIRTEGLDQYGEEQVAEWAREVPLGRLGTAEEIGEVIAFLATPAAAYISGTTIVIDGALDVLPLRGSPS